MLSTARGKRGFSLVELLIVMVVIAILAGIVAISAGGLVSRANQFVYEVDEENLQRVTLSHFADTGTWPTKDGTIGPYDPDKTAVDMIKLIDTEYLLAAPASASSINIDGGTGPYTWYVDSDLRVKSEPEP